MPKPSLDEIFGSSSKPSLDEIFGQQSKPKPMFSSVEEANAAMKNAKSEQAFAEFNASGINPYVNAMGKTAEDIAPFVLGGSVSGGLSRLAGSSILKQAGAGAAGGAVTGAMSPADNLQQRALNTIGSAATGAALGGGLQAATGGLKNLISAGKRIKGSFTGPSSSDLKAGLDQKILELSKEKENLDSLFKLKSSEFAIRGKQAVPEISKKMSTAYGDALEEIFNKLDDPLQVGSVLKKNAPPITNQDLVLKLEDLVSKTSNNPLIIKSEAYNKAVKMLDFYKNGAKSQAGLVDEAGRVLSSNAPEAVDISKLIAQTRDIRSTISKSNSPLSADDYFATQFDRVVSGLLKDRVEGFSELQKSFAPMANTRKVAYKVFKPLSDEDSTTALLNRIKNNNLRTSDEKLIKFIESGGEIGGKKIPGVGDMTSEFKSIGSRLKQINSRSEIKELSVKLSKKAADEKFRNAVLTWAATGASAVGGFKLLKRD